MSQTVSPGKRLIGGAGYQGAEVLRLFGGPGIFRAAEDEVVERVEALPGEGSEVRPVAEPLARGPQVFADGCLVVVESTVEEEPCHGGGAVPVLGEQADQRTAQ
jgi:hypothetical protein